DKLVTGVQTCALPISTSMAALDRPVERCPVQRRHRRGPNHREPAEACHGECDPECTARAGDDETFGHELPGEARPAGAECAANRQLALSSGVACEDEVRDVGAGDE